MTYKQVSYITNLFVELSVSMTLNSRPGIAGTVENVHVGSRFEATVAHGIGRKKQIEVMVVEISKFGLFRLQNLQHDYDCWLKPRCLIGWMSLKVTEKNSLTLLK